VQIYTKCAVLILICAVLTADLSGGANSAPQASRLDFGDRERKGKDSGRGKKGKGRRGKGEGQREGEGIKREMTRKGRRKGGILYSCDFSLKETLEGIKIVD